MDIGFGDILSGVSKVVGGIMGQNAADNNEQMQKDIYQDQRAWQREMALSGVQFRVDDAKAAGIAPLAALGAQLYNPSPVSVGSTSTDSPLGSAIASSGQDIARALNATRSTQDKVDAFTKATQDLTLQKMGLENELLASQVRKANSAGVSPAFPVAGKQRQLVDGQANTDIVTVGGHPVKIEDIETKKDTFPAHETIRFGVPIRTNPYFADAQHIEDRYGDVVEEISGVANLGADALYTLKRLIDERRERALRADSDPRFSVPRRLGRR